MSVQGRTIHGETSWLAVARCGLWPTVLAVVFATGQETAPPTSPAASAPAPSAPAPSAPAAVTPAKEVPAAKDGSMLPTVPWEYAPYTIHVWLAAAPSPELGENILDRLRRDLAQSAEVVVGAPWSITVAAPPASLYYTVAMCPQLLTQTTIAAAEKDRLKDDKLMVVSLSASPRAWTVWAREFDCHARTWGPRIVRVERQPDRLSSTVFAAVIAAFGPLARIEEGQGKVCVARGRATGLITTPDSPAQIGKGDVLQPIFRQNDRYGNPVPGKTEALPFTFLQVTSHDPESPSLLNCNVHSGMRSPIHGRAISTSRRERWAIKVRPHFPESTLFVESKLMKRTDPKLPLSGVEVFSKIPEPEVPKELTEEEKKIADKRNPAELLGVTDWRGSLSVGHGGPTLRVLYLKNGGLLLARLPVVPGLDERIVAEIPDDNPRLQAEGFVRGMNSEVTDLVVQRQLIAVRMRKKISEAKLDDAEKLFEEFRGLKTLNNLQLMLNQQIQRQKPTNNPAVRQKIDKLYAEERELLTKYIDADLQVKLLAELSQARANPAPPPKAETPESPSASEASTDPEKKKALPGALKTK